MQEYDIFDLLYPWMGLIAILIPLVYAERWVHQHFFGIGYLISQDKASATRLFYVFFLPGILIHEAIQYLVAGALNVPIKRIIAWPEKQENGTMRLDFIVVDQTQTDWVRAALVAASPFLVMSGMVWYISTQVLDLHTFTESLGTGDITVMWAAIAGLFDKSDFVLWLYLLFVVANSMVPKREDARGLPILLGVLVALVTAMLFLGLDAVLVDTLGGSVAEALGLVNTALLSILVLDLVGILILGITEDTLERWRGFKMDYSPGDQLTRSLDKKAKREPGSDEPYPKGEPLPSIYGIDLPLPDPTKLSKPVLPRPEPSRAPSAASPITARETTPSAAREPAAASAAASQRPAARTPSQPGQFARREAGEQSAEERPARSREDFEAERARTFGSRTPGEQPAGDRPARTPSQQGQFARREAGEQPAEERPARSREDFEAERARLFGTRRPADKPAERDAARTGTFPRSPQSRESESAPPDRPARPTGAVSPARPQLRRPDASSFRPGEPASRQLGNEAEESAEDVRYEDFEDVEVPDDDDEFYQDVDEEIDEEE